MTRPEATPSDTSGAAPDWLGMARSASTALEVSNGDAGLDLMRELLVIGVNGSAYAIPVERVREIVRTRALTRIPRAPEWLLGVLALRGEVVEVVDLRRRLGVEPVETGRSSRIIVLHGDGDRVAGVLVDSVSDVFRVSEDKVLSAEELELSTVVEMCQRGCEFISILDIDRVLGFPDV
jgi:purine-binding chemotaxis protein CheW